jgi:hypothetical protein
MNDFQRKIQSIRFGKIQTKTIKRDGAILGEHHVHLSGRVDAVVMPQLQEKGNVHRPLGGSSV